MLVISTFTRKLRCGYKIRSSNYSYVLLEYTNFIGFSAFFFGGGGAV